MKNPTLEQLVREFKSKGKGYLQIIDNSFVGEGWIENKALLTASGKDPELYREAYFEACDFFFIPRPVDPIINKSRIEFEGHLNSYKNVSDEELMALRPRFTGDQWKLNKASLQRADLCPFALKEAFLKALDYRGIKRPDCGRFVPESEAFTGDAFWKTPANPVTGTKIHDSYDWEDDVNNSVSYGYEYNNL